MCIRDSVRGHKACCCKIFAQELLIAGEAESVHDVFAAGVSAVAAVAPIAEESDGRLSDRHDKVWRDEIEDACGEEGARAKAAGAEEHKTGRAIALDANPAQVVGEGLATGGEAAGEIDFKFAREIAQVIALQDGVFEGFGGRACIGLFGRADAGPRAAADIACDIATGIFAGQAMAGELGHDAGDIGEFDPMELEALAGGNTNLAEGVAGGECGHETGLRGGEAAAGDARAHHEKAGLELLVHAGPFGEQGMAPGEGVIAGCAEGGPVEIEPGLFNALFGRQAVEFLRIELR